ncbi:carbohydrate ABC transporter permease [Hydrogenibacillus schlegelii]|nr:sugar ABC transporter permease [Hydrogenibacillus schlegelii]
MFANMGAYGATLIRWALVPVFLLLIAALLYGMLRLIGWRPKPAFGLALVSPWLVGFLVFMAFPLLYSLYLSFTDFSIFSGGRWVGLQNYARLFFHDREFWPSLRLTVLYALVTVPIGVVGALLVALLLSQRVKAIGLFRTIYYLPAVLPEVAVALLWRWLFNSESGLINRLLAPLFRILRIDQPDWFGDPHYVLPAFIIMSLWGIFGTNVVIFLAALTDVPRSLYEAAEIDGAVGWQKLIYITIPQISPIILLQVVMGMISALQIFTVAMFVRPTSAAGKFMNQLVYERGFVQLHMGEASAIAWVLFLLILILTLIIFRSSPAWVYYEGRER